MTKNTALKIAAVSFLILFTELLLIKYIGTEIRLFAYIPNLILLAAFIGSSAGMMIKRKIPLYLSNILIVVILALVLSGKLNIITDNLAIFSDSFIWFTLVPKTAFSVILAVVLVIVIFLFLLFIFVPMGGYLGELFEVSDNLNTAYSINILFSLFGVLFHAWFSSLTISPYLSLLLIMIVVVLLSEKKHLMYSIISIAIILPLLVGSMFILKDTVWSQYQKLRLDVLPDIEYLPPGKLLNVNNIGYMGLIDLSEAYQKTVPEKIASLNLPIDPASLPFLNQYNLPFVLKPESKRTLIIGAGGGNDVAGALRAGVEDIDAVEIDREIIEFGRKYHPEKPYDNSKVHIVIDDGRAFLRRTTESYDVIIMGLADSHTLNSNLTNIQLDNFLYTRESISEAYKKLNDDGILFISFDVRKPWIGRRISKNFELAFGNKPLVINMQNEIPILGWGGVIFAASKNPNKLTEVIENNAELKKFIDARNMFFTDPDTILRDDWPYLYLETTKIPFLHILITALLLILFWIFMSTQNIKNSFDISAFLLGIGFLLYEFQNIGRTSLLYGNTWKTNTMIISSILLITLLANFVYAKSKPPVKMLYLLLVVAFIFQLVFPVQNYFAFSKPLLYGVVPILINLPLLFSGMIFISLFEKTKDRSAFFSSNLAGSALGGLLTFISYIYGIKFLIFVCFIIYILSYFTIRSKRII